jgi:hypothetical protein
MIVYVESNFCLEFAFQQEEYQYAEDLLKLAEASKIDLAFPQFALCEPFSTINRYGNERARFLVDLNRQLSELDRSAPHQPLVAGVRPLVATLARLQQGETDRLEEAIERMLKCGRSLPLTGPVFAAARQAESAFDLSPQDAIVLASVLEDLKSAPAAVPGEHCFVSRNSKDFAAARGNLTTLHCRYIAKFGDALSFITSKI